MKINSPSERELFHAPTTHQYSQEIGGASFDEIAAAIGVSRWRAQQICNRALWKLLRACKRRGIDASDIRGRVGSMLAQAEIWGME